MALRRLQPCGSPAPESLRGTESSHVRTVPSPRPVDKILRDVITMIDTNERSDRLFFAVKIAQSENWSASEQSL
jgi:hypothetical protein